MASSWGRVVSEQADQTADRLRQLVSSGLHFLRDEFGLDLGLKPELYPAWVIPTTVLIGLLALLVLVAACGGSRRRKHGAARSKSATASTVSAAAEGAKAAPVKAPKADEPKKKNKKKSAEKKNQSNGGTVHEPREQVKAVKEVPKQASAAPAAAKPPQRQSQPPPQPPQPSPRPSPQPQASVDAKAEKAKKSKKKPKPEVKPTQAVSSSDGKEPDEGAWETKISNREKRQQRKKEKGSNDESGSPGGGQQKEQQPPAPVNTKKNKESLNLKAAKADASISPVLSTWNNVSSVNAGGRTDTSAKLPLQVNASDREKSSAAIKTSGHRTSETIAWTQDAEGSWSNIDGRIKPELNRINFSMPRLNQSAAGVPVTQPSSGEMGNGLPCTDEWSGFNGLGAVDPSSDWNAPTELWGNYDEPKPDKPAAQEPPISQLQESDDDKDKGDPSGSSKSKRKKKKKKKPEDEAAGSQVNTESSSVPAESGFVKPRPHVQVEDSTKKIALQSGQKKSDQNLEPQKQTQKKKARRET